MTTAMAEEMLLSLQNAFEIVRLIDPLQNKAYILEKGALKELQDTCFSFWNRVDRCENCVCAQAMATGQKQMKFELIGSSTYQITARTIEIEGRTLCIEMINLLSDELLFGTFGQERFMRNLAAYNRTLYTDALTDAYNRRYYEEHQESLARANAIVMLDADHFKHINDTYGHPCGDEALRSIVIAAKANTRRMDSIIRYGGDEFLIAFQNIPENALRNRLQQISDAVQAVKLTAYPQLQLSVSMGAVFRRPGSSSLALSDMVQMADTAMYQAKNNLAGVVIVDAIS